MITKEISNDLFFTNIRHIIDSGNRVELRVKGISMYPTLEDGKHKVVLKPYHSQALKVGTLALFVYNKKYILHRLISIEENKLIFKGDNLTTEECISRKDIIAVVEFIITPSGKVIDCNKQSFFIRNNLRLLMNRYYIMPCRVAKGYIKKYILKIKN